MNGKLTHMSAFNAHVVQSAYIVTWSNATLARNAPQYQSKGPKCPGSISKPPQVVAFEPQFSAEGCEGIVSRRTRWLSKMLSPKPPKPFTLNPKP